MKHFDHRSQEQISDERRAEDYKTGGDSSVRSESRGWFGGAERPTEELL
jgi:hypothetical protein